MEVWVHLEYFLISSLDSTEPAREELWEELSPVLSPRTSVFLCGQSGCLAVFNALPDTRLEPPDLLPSQAYVRLGPQQAHVLLPVWTAAVGYLPSCQLLGISGDSPKSRVERQGLTYQPRCSLPMTK